MPTENRSSNTEMVSELLPCPFCGQQDFLIERLDSDASVVICQGLTGPHEACLARGPVGVAQDEGEEQPGHDKAIELWNARAEQHQGETDNYPPCDYCGITPDHHPWHGSGLLNGVENRHIHACDGCRGKLPLHPGQHEGEPIAWVVGSAIWWNKHQAEVDAKLVGEPAIPLGRLADAGEVERLRESLLRICTALGMPAGQDMHTVGPELANALRNLLHNQDRQLAERDALLGEQSGKLIVLAARLLQEPLRVLNHDLDSDGPITRIKVTDGVERASDSLGGLVLEVRRAANALSAIASPAVAAPQYPNRLCHIDYQAHPYLCGCLRGDEEAQKIYDDHMRSAKS